MINNWKTLSSSDYSTALYNFFVTTETLNKVPDFAAYSDSRGFLSIGVGFNLTAQNVQQAVFSELGLVLDDPRLSGNSVLNADENNYITELKAAIASTNALEFNATLVARSQDAALTAVLGAQPTGLSPTAALNVFNNIILAYESDVNTWLPGVPDSNERIALVSLAYNTKTGLNGLPTGLGVGLRNAIQDGDRAEAWYQIRFGTNKGALSATPPADARGLAKRRYYESQLFGLYGVRDQPSQLESARAYQTLTAHRATIVQYERLYGTDPDGSAPEVANNRIATANSEYSLPASSQVETLAASFDSAFQVIVGQLQTLYGGVLPQIVLDQAGAADTASAPFSIRSTDVYVAPTQAEVVANFATAEHFRQEIMSHVEGLGLTYGRLKLVELRPHRDELRALPLHLLVDVTVGFIAQPCNSGFCPTYPADYALQRRKLRAKELPTALHPGPWFYWCHAHLL